MARDRMKNNEIRIGLLGCGGIVGSHANAFSKLTDKGRVVAVAEPNKDRYPQIKKWFGDDIKIVSDYSCQWTMSMRWTLSCRITCTCLR